ncbi:MAG: host attachment protein [Rhodocyclaceae bacterium]|nr:host attachment protein [Rhodocyclaceae bacterium]MCP5239035.1 host attachment protein [Zoogloeaceae bacterium]MCP5254077.1 host attachment protein [Zoogloeaceae bacterium]MCP5295252.1 host attachment protein [Zoogloeaceae bacterium]MCW5613687.1 host attachment protein [Rhodocyclaceae bacterium]
MAITWILVANASLAKLYANLGPNKGLKLVKELVHPESRQKNAELVTDKIGTGNGNGSYEPASQPKEQAARSFAHQIAKELYAGRSRNEFERAILVAPPAFMGMLNSNLDGPTSQLVSDRFEKDYTKTSEPALVAHLSSCIFL